MRKTFLFILALCATTLAWGATTVTKTVDQLATMHGWTAATAYQSFTLDDVISVAAKTSSDKICTYPNGYYTSSKWYMYQGDSNGEFTISAALGYIIKTIKITYSPQNSGILSFKSGFGIAEADQIASGSSVTVDKRSATLYVGCTAASSSSTNINARITQFTVTYELVEQSLIEEFRDPVGDTLWNHSTAATTKLGTYGEWEMEGIRHTNPSNDMDKLKTKNTPGVGIGWVANPHMQTTAEGGVKALSFLWNQGATAKETNKTEKITVTVGDQTQYDTFTGTTTASRPNDRTFVFSPEVKSNATLRLEGVNGNRIVVGPITIVPYLRYTYTEMQEEKIGEGTFDCSLQIDNTDNEGTITYSSDNTDVVSFASATNPEATLVGGGEATITATWSEGASTSFKLKVITKSTPEISFENEAVTITNLYTTEPVVNKLAVTKGAGEVTYTSSNPLVAKIVSNQVTVVGVGTATITATTAENEDYVSASASYALTVNEPTGETAVSEDFEGKLPLATSYQTEPVNFTDQDSLYFWTVNGHRYDGTWLRFATNEYACMTSQGIQEGGVKRLSFTWKRASGECAKIHTTIKALDGDGNEIVDRSIELAGSEDQKSNQTYNMRFDEVKQNAQFYLRNESDGFVILISDIKIVPYLLYTKKDTIIDMDQATNFINDKLIDNRDDEEAIVYSIVGENDGVASIDAATGKVTASKAGTVTVQAKWGGVTTTYSLTINSKNQVDAKFATEGKVEKVLANGSFTNAVVVTAGDATPAYTSDNANVAEVNASTGEVTIKAIGTATITATMAETDNYFAWEDSYTLVVRTGIEDSKKLVEHFTQMPKGLISTADGEEVEGDIDVTWLAYSARRGTNDTIGGAGVQGINIHTKGYVNTKSELEGGIKYFSFNWKQWATENNCTLKLRAELGNSEYSMEKAGTGPATYEHYFFAINAGIKSNVGIALYNESYNEDGPLVSNGRITFDAFEIVPYLYYKTKSDTIDNAAIGAIYTNTDLINNIDNNEGTIAYSLISEGADDIASINASTGEVTVKAGGVVTVQAKWVPDATKQDEFVTTTYELTINFPTPEVTFTAPETVALDGTIGEEDMDVVVKVGGEPVDNPTITYTSSNNNVIKITDAGWNVIGIGTTTITANVDGTTTYGPASATAEIEVTNITPAEGTYWKETFSSLKVKDNYNTNLTTIEGDNNVLKWKTRNFQHSTTDKVNSDQGIRLRNAGTDDYNKPGYVEYYTDNEGVSSQEGGIKYVQFQWRIPGDQDNKKVVFDVKYKEGDQTVVRTLTYNGIAHATVYDYAQNFNLKNNNKLTIAGSTGSESPVIVGPITIVPYLLYTKKDTIIDMDQATNFINDKLIDNRDDEEAIVYSIIGENDGVATIDAATGEVTGLKAGKVTIQAAWGEVSTTYTLKVTKAAEPALTRDDLHEGQLITVCLDKNITSVEGGTFYQIEQGTTSEITFAEFAEDEFPIAKATPLLFQSDGTTMKVFCGTDRVDDGDKEKIVEYRAMKGIVNTATTLQTPIEQGNILVNGGQLRLVGANCVLTPGHAYIDVAELAQLGSLQQTPSGAPRRTIRLYNPDAAPTNLNGLNGTVKPMKVLRDGQLYIIRDTKTYNAQGIEVQ